MRDTPSRYSFLALALAGLVFCALTFNAAHVHEFVVYEDCVQCLHLSQFDDAVPADQSVAAHLPADSKVSLPTVARVVSCSAPTRARGPPTA